MIDKSAEINDFLNENQLKTVGKRIRALREYLNCSQKEFCTLFDIPQSTLSAYETDKMQPTLATLICMATRCSVSMDWLCCIDKKQGENRTIDKNIELNAEVKNGDEIKIDLTLHICLDNQNEKEDK